MMDPDGAMAASSLARAGPDPAVAWIVAEIRARAAQSGSPCVIAIDGPAGSGKTTLAARLAELLDDPPIVHMDDLYDDWADGPDGGAARLAALVLQPLTAGMAGSYRRYDWLEKAWAEQRLVPPAPVVIIEGCGAGAQSPTRPPGLLVWIEVSDDVRLRRGLVRDGEEQRELWLAWMAAEAAHFARERTRSRADIRLDGGDYRYHESP
jgi:uridine kinase